MSENVELRNIVITTLARGALVELRVIHEQCDDAETARPIYAELRRLAYEIAKKHDFLRSQGHARMDLLQTNKTGSWPAQVL